MTGKQEAFCREFVALGDASAAAERAGYRHPESAALRLLDTPEVQERIETLSVANRDEVRAFLTRTLRGDGTVSERMKAADMLLKCGVKEARSEPLVIFGEQDLE